MSEIVERSSGGRSITGIAGPPGAGKSTLATAIRDALDATEAGSAGLLQMDAYHLDDRVLEARGLSDRKGAPQTFDVGGLLSMLGRLKENVEPEIAIPVFDRGIEIARAGAAVVPRSARHILVEGNYLLLDCAPWSGLFPLLDTTVLITADVAVLRRRLASRWERLTASQISGKVEGNDLLNATLVMSSSRAAEFVIDGTKPARRGATRRA